MNLKESVRQWVLRELPYDPADANLIAYLNGLDAHGLLVVYHNWMSRLIKPQPRQVRKSKAFLQNPLVVERTNEFAQIIDDIEKGWDLRKYLGRGVKTAVGVPGKPFEKRRDLDLMLNAQGVHHLHISTQVEADGYVKRGGPLLFAVFKPRTAYLIDVMGHGDWTRDRVLEVLANEWPNESLVHEIKGVIGLASNYTEDERAMLQKNGVNTAVEIDGKVLLPAGAMTVVGTSLAAGREADKVLLQIGISLRHISKIQGNLGLCSKPMEPPFLKESRNSSLQFYLMVGGSSKQSPEHGFPSTQCLYQHEPACPHRRPRQ